MNLTDNVDNIVYIIPKRKIGFTQADYQTKIYNVGEYLENLVKNLIRKDEPSEINKSMERLFFFIDRYPENPYSQFGYALFILTQQEDSEYRYQIAREYVEHGLCIDEKNVDGIDLNIRIFSYLIKIDKKYISEAKKFIKKQLEITPDNSELITYLKNIEEEENDN